MIKVKDGYGKLIGSEYKGSADLVLLSDGSNLGYAIPSTGNTLVLRNTSGQIESSLTTDSNLSPFVVTSTVVNTNLNSDLLDGFHAGGLFLTLSSSTSVNLTVKIGNTEKKIEKLYATYDGLGNTIAAKYVTLDTALTISGVKTFSSLLKFTASSVSPFTVDSNVVVTNLNADLLDGTHKADLFTDFSNITSGTDANKVSITIGGTTKKIIINYAQNAGSIGGVTAGGLFTALTSTPAKNLSITIGGTTKDITSLYSNYWVPQAIGSKDFNTMYGDTYRGTSWYGGGSNTATNNPLGSGLAFGMLIWRNADGYTALLIMGTDGRLYVRVWNGSSWSQLLKFAYATDAGLGGGYWANVKVSATSSTTTSPTFANATLSGKLTFTTAGVNASISFLNGELIDGYGNVLLGTNSTSWNIFDSSRNYLLTVLKNGNVGIGTTSPSYKLHVNGTSHSSNYQAGAELYLKAADTACQTTIFGSNGSGYRMRIIRLLTAADLNTLYSPTLVVSSLDTHAYIAWSYSSDNVWVGGGSGNKWNWRSKLVTSNNYGSYLGYIGTTPVQKSAAAQALTGITRISNSANNVLYLGNSNNSSWVLTLNICSHSGASKWAINVNGYAWFSKLMVGIAYNGTGSNYAVNVSGDSHVTGWSRANIGFYVEGAGVHYTHQGTLGEINMTNNNEFLWSTSNGALHFNYRAASRGTTVTNYTWNAGSSSSYASHTLGALISRGDLTLYGLTQTCNKANDANYMNSALQIREYNFGGAQSDTWAIAPRLSWHWSGRVQTQIGLNSSGDLKLSRDNFATSYLLLHLGNSSVGNYSVTIGNTAKNFVRDWGHGASDMNAVARGGRSSMGMANLSTPSGGTASYVNPNGLTDWHHFINIAYTDGGAGSNSWITQIANKAGTTDLWVRSRSGGTISNTASWAAGWTRILTGSNYTNVLDGRYLRYNGWWTSGNGNNANNAVGMVFAYSDHNVPNSWGILTTFDYLLNSSYRFLLFANGYSNALYYRSRSADLGGWTGWCRVIDQSNITGYYWANVKISATSSTTTTPTFGNTTINGTLAVNGGAKTVAITHNHTLTTAWNDFITCLNPKLTTTYHTAHIAFGRTYTSKNTGYIGFKYAGDASNSNMVTIGLHSVDNILNILASGSVGVGTTSPSSKLHVSGGTLKITNYNNTMTIGSQNTSWGHIENSANINFYFNRSVHVDGAIWRYNTNYGIDSDGKFYAHTVYANLSGSSTAGGVSLYSNSDPMTYGIAFRTTANYGTHGWVTGDWATYLTMSNTANRGWIFRTSDGTRCLSINTSGSLYANGAGFFGSNVSAANSGWSTPGDAAFEAREYARAGTNTSTAPHSLMYAPRVGFHWGNRYWGNIIFYDSAFRFMNNNASSYVNIYAANLYGTVSNITVHDSNANSTYRMVWHSGNTLYSTNNIYCNPSADQIYSAGFRHVSYNSASYLLRSDGGAAAFNWSGQSGQPTWLWGGNSQHTYYVYNPSNFNVWSAAVLRGNASNPDNSHPGHGAKVFYSWNTGQAGNASSGYSNGITIGSHPNDTSYGFLIVQNMWDDRTYTRRYNGGWLSWKTLAWTSDIPNPANYYWANIRVSASSSTGTLPTFNTCWTSNWFRSTSATGWYNETYLGGIHMLDSTWVRTYNGKSFYCSAVILAGNRIYTGYDSGLANSISCSNWFRSNGTSGWYNPTNNCHVYPNATTTYGGLMLRGEKGGYTGFILGTSTNYMNLMDNGTDKGLYQEGKLWILYYNRSNNGVGIRTSAITKNFNVSGLSYLSSNTWIGTTSGGEMLNVGGWVGTTGNAGWYSLSYAGGIYMQDTTWVRVYNNKKFYVGNSEYSAIHSAGGVYVAGAVHSYANLLKSTCNSRTISIGSLNSSWCHYSTDAPAHWFNKPIYVLGNLYGGSGHNRRVAYVDEISNTWRGVENVLTSTSTSNSLTANMGRVLANGASDRPIVLLAGTLYRNGASSSYTTWAFTGYKHRSISSSNPTVYVSGGVARFYFTNASGYGFSFAQVCANHQASGEATGYQSGEYQTRSSGLFWFGTYAYGLYLYIRAIALGDRNNDTAESYRGMWTNYSDGVTRVSIIAVGYAW